METRIVSPSDQEIIIQLSQHPISCGEAASIEGIHRLLSDGKSYLLVIMEKKDLIGYALAYRFPSLSDKKDLAYLYDIEVITAFRRQGYGRSLLLSLLDQLNQAGVDEVWLGTAVGNFPAQKLFESTGGLQSGETYKEYFYSLSGNKIPEPNLH